MAEQKAHATSNYCHDIGYTASWRSKLHGSLPPNNNLPTPAASLKRAGTSQLEWSPGWCSTAGNRLTALDHWKRRMTWLL